MHVAIVTEKQRYVTLTRTALDLQSERWPVLVDRPSRQSNSDETATVDVTRLVRGAQCQPHKQEMSFRIAALLNVSLFLIIELKSLRQGEQPQKDKESTRKHKLSGNGHL